MYNNVIAFVIKTILYDVLHQSFRELKKKLNAFL